MHRSTTCTVLVFVLCSAAWAAERPVAVSPGSATGAMIGDTCPTFSWGAVLGAKSYELVVYRLGEEGAEARPLLSQRISGSALSWTPSLNRCLERGGQYAWSVRALGEKAASDWSPPSLFQVASGPNEVEFEEAVAVVRQYLARGGEIEAEAAGRSESDSETSREASARALPPANTKLSVDGNLDATSFSGDGSRLTNLDAALVTTCLGRRWLDQGNGTVLDCNTKKIWLKDASCLGQAPWTLGVVFTPTIFSKVASLNAGTDFGCADYPVGTYDDWRVPTISELCSAGAISQDCPVANYATSLVDNRFGGGFTVSNANGEGRWTEGDAFVGVQESHYWSATAVDATNAWNVDLDPGSVLDNVDKTVSFWVWPVRGPE